MSGEGLKPSSSFDPSTTASFDPDVVASGRKPALSTILNAGRAEGRRPIPIADTLMFPLAGLKPDKQTVLVLIHDASRTGAPILGWNIVRRYAIN